MSRRPEHQAPPELFYNEEEARKYTQNSRIIEIQGQMTERCIELLLLPEDTPCLLLDIGCGSGLSGTVLEENGHMWLGMDISSAMLDVALERDTEGDLILADMGEGVPFRAGCFDGAVSVSAIQWLFNADKKYHHPVKRLYKFFSTLYASLSTKSAPMSRDETMLLVQLVAANKIINNKTTNATNNKLKEQAWQTLTNEFNSSVASFPRTPAQLRLKWENLKKAARKRCANMRSSLHKSRSARAVFQFYPENESQMELLTTQAMKAGFYGGVVIDYPNSAKAKKFFLVLMTGGAAPLPQALGTEETDNSLQVKYAKREATRGIRGKPMKNTKAWLLEKKERRRKQGKETRPDTKYTGRKRSGRF